MKFSVSSSELLKQLALGNGAISSNPVLPILEDFLFTIKDNVLTIASSNLESTIITSMDVLADMEGNIAVPAKILIETLKALPEQPLNFNIEEETNAIELTSAYGKYGMAGDDVADFPDIPLKDNVESFTLNSNILIQAINKTLFASSNDELRQAMMGMFVQVDFDKITFVATDAHKLVKYLFRGIKSDITASFIIPKKGLTLLKNALEENVEVKISFNSLNIFVEFGTTQVIIRLIEAKYPEYNAVIPVKNENTLVISRRDFQHSLRRIAIYANKSTNQVIFNLNEGSLTISAQDLDFSNEATEQLSCTYEGDAMVIGFNAKFLIEMLGVIESDEVLIKLGTSKLAGILTPAIQNSDEELMMLVMPVMMNY